MNWQKQKKRITASLFNLIQVASRYSTILYSVAQIQRRHSSTLATVSSHASQHQIHNLQWLTQDVSSSRVTFL